MVVNRKRLLALSGWWFAIAVVVFGVLIPDYYLWSTRIPEFENLNKTQGVLTHEKVSNRRGWKVGLSQDDGQMFFTCSDRGSRQTCYADRMKLPDHEGLAGKPVTVWWYEQPVYLFATQRRLVQLDAGGTTLISRSETVSAVKRRAARSPWVLVGVCVLIGLVIWFIPSGRQPRS